MRLIKITLSGTTSAALGKCAATLFRVDSHYHKSGTHTYNMIKAGRTHEEQYPRFEFPNTALVEPPTVKNKRRKPMQKGRAFKRFSNTQNNSRFGLRVEAPLNLELNQGRWTMFHGSERFVGESDW